MPYSNEELADIIFVYGACEGNQNEARREYARRYPNRNVPNPRTFSSMFRRLRETGRFDNLRGASGPRRGDHDSTVLRMVRNDPSLSVRRISARTGVSKTQVWQMLKEEKLHAYHLTPVQELLQTDFEKRTRFCQWLTLNAANAQKILWSDESTFTKDGVFNYHNQHQWAATNPHAKREGKSQFKISVNVWAGIIGTTLIGPHIFPGTLNAQMYLEFLSSSLPELLEEVPLNLGRQMIFQHDGAPPHFSSAVKSWLDINFPNRWIGRNGPILWPPRSPDLTPLDFYLWGRLKDIVYSTAIRSREHLIERLNEAVTTVRAEMLTINFNAEFQKRANACVAQGGGHFENI